MSLIIFKNNDKTVVMNKYKYQQLVDSIIKSDATDDEKINQLKIVIDSILNHYLN